MKTTYRRIVRRRIEAALRLQVQRPGPRPKMDEPVEMQPELVDVATGEILPRPPAHAQRSWRRLLEDS